MNVLRLVSFFAIAGLAGCIVENDPPRRIHDGEPYAPPAAAAPGSGSTAPAPPAAPPAPMLVEVDTDQTMTADPGQGVGVFVEYARGGRWHVWWTCDTAKTRQSCDFSVSVTAAAGNVSNVDASRLEGGFVATPTPSRVDAKITTSTQAHGISFSTNPGAVITLEASVGGIKDGSFLFFVQDGKVNGGFTGRLTNPLQLQGKSP
jgi:hypothetical protein